MCEKLLIEMDDTLVDTLNHLSPKETCRFSESDSLFTLTRVLSVTDLPNDEFLLLIGYHFKNSSF